MAKILKLMLGAVLLVIVGVVVAAVGLDDPAENIKTIQGVAKGEGINKAEFEQLENGMTYEQVKTIIGTEGELVSESGAAKVYSWEGETGLGSNANVTFMNDKLEVKAQYGL